MKSINVFVIAVLAASALIVACYVGLDLACRSTVAPRGGDATPINFVLQPAVQLVQAQPQSGTAPALSAWQRNFLCGITATDLALAGFALFLVIAVSFQGLWMWNAVRATERSAAVVDRAMVATQRAYVVFKEFRVNVNKLSPIEEIQSVTVQPVWENSGTTPTRNGRSHINWRYFERSIPNDVDLADFDDMGNRVLAYESYSPLVIGPKSTSFSSLILIDGSTIRMVREMQGRVLIWGWCEYDDVFENTRRHRTEFCYQLFVTGGMHNTQINFSQFRRFNGVDDDCERQPTALTRQS
jgi:hypothetical protein